jgi:hypothetical protein
LPLKTLAVEGAKAIVFDFGGKKAGGEDKKGDFFYVTADLSIR